MPYLSPFLPDKPLILFDGVCSLCNGYVNLLIKIDKNKKVLICPLQSEKGKNILNFLNLDQTEFDTFIFIKEGKAHFRSTAILMLCKEIGGLISLFRMYLIVPASIRDMIYNFIAKRRYLLFGKKDSCRVPSKGDLEHFY